MLARIYLESEDVQPKLTELSLDEEIIRAAVWAGERAAAGRTEHDMPNARGYYRVNETLRELRDLLVKPSSGWQAVNDGLYTVRHQRLGIQIAVMSGNEATGNPAGVPDAKNPRGSASEMAIEINNQLTLPGMIEWIDDHRANRQAADGGRIVTWVLLLLPIKSGVRCELLLPTELKNGRIVDYTERIILGDYIFAAEADLDELESYDAGVQFDVDVQSR